MVNMRMHGQCHSRAAAVFANGWLDYHSHELLGFSGPYLILSGLLKVPRNIGLQIMSKWPEASPDCRHSSQAQQAKLFSSIRGASKS